MVTHRACACWSYCHHHPLLLLDHLLDHHQTLLLTPSLRLCLRPLQCSEGSRCLPSQVPLEVTAAAVHLLASPWLSSLPPSENHGLTHA